MAVKAKKDAVPSGPLNLKRIDLRTLRIPIIGISELIVHNWSEKAKREMLGNQMTPGIKTKRSPKDPMADYEASKYKMPDGSDGFPSISFKLAMVDALRFYQGVTMVMGKMAFFVEGDLVKIEGDPRMREDMVRLATGVADIRHRAGYPRWSAVLDISYNPVLLTDESILALVDAAGRMVGVGENRPSSKNRTGPYGRFQVDETKPIEKS